MWVGVGGPGPGPGAAQFKAPTRPGPPRPGPDHACRALPCCLARLGPARARPMLPPYSPRGAQAWSRPRAAALARRPGLAMCQARAQVVSVQHPEQHPRLEQNKSVARVRAAGAGLVTGRREGRQPPLTGVEQAAYPARLSPACHPQGTANTETVYDCVMEETLSSTRSPPPLHCNKY